MSRPLYPAVEDNPAVRYEQDDREQVRCKIDRARARGLTLDQALRAVLGPPGSQARQWWGP